MHPRGRGSLWEIAIPDGTYQVDVLAGDPKSSAGRNTLEVNGAVVINAKVTRTAKWAEASSQFTVSDGAPLAITVPRGLTAKIDSIVITQIVTTPPVVNPVTPPPPPTPTTNTPYLGTPFSTDQVIPASDYDIGGEGVAYHDTTATNLGNDSVRGGDAVDIDTGGTTGNVVTDTEAGEWLDYTINVPTAGSYVLEVSVASSSAGGSFHAEFDGTNLAGSNLTGPITVPNTESATAFQAVTTPSFPLPAGQTTMRIVFDQDAASGGAGIFDTFEVAAPPVVPPVVTPLDHPLVWQTAANAPQALAEAQSTSVNGKLYVFGGYNITSPDYQANTASEVYDPAANKWTTLAPMPVPETHMAVTNDGTNIYIAGGYTYNPRTTYQTFATTNVWKYDIATNAWSAFVPLPSAIGAGTMVYLGTQLHFFDGVNVNRIGQTEHWVLDPGSANPRWTNSPPLPFSRNHMTSAVLDGKIYAIGGQPTDNDSNTSSDVLAWDPANPSAWTAVANMPIPRSHAVTAIVDGEIIVAGGTTTNDTPISSVIIYDPSTNMWSNSDGRSRQRAWRRWAVWWEVNWSSPPALAAETSRPRLGWQCEHLNQCQAIFRHIVTVATPLDASDMHRNS